MKLEIDWAFGFALFRNDPQDLALGLGGRPDAKDDAGEIGETEVGISGVPSRIATSGKAATA